MIATDIQIPAEYNKYNITGESGKTLDTSNSPFELFYEDECGNLTEFDATSEEYNFKAFNNNCEIPLSDSILSEGNKIWLVIPDLDIRKGSYDYLIEFLDGTSIISGKLKVLK